MSETAIGTIGIIALFVLLALRMPVAMTMLVVGFFMIWAVMDESLKYPGRRRYS